MLAAINQPHFYSSPAAVWLPGQTNWASKEWNNKKQGEKCHCHCLYTVGTRQTLIIPASFTSEKLWWWLYAASCKNDCQTTAAAVCIKRQRIKNNFFMSVQVHQLMGSKENAFCTKLPMYRQWLNRKEEEKFCTKQVQLTRERKSRTIFFQACPSHRCSRKGLTKYKK